MKKIIHNGTSINLVSSNGPFVIMIHGLGLNKKMWSWQANELSKYYSVITYDLIGHGNSKDPGEIINLEYFSNQIVEIMDCFSIDQTALIGFSLGGMIARKFAIRFNEKLWGLVILNSAYERNKKSREAVQQRVNIAIKNGPSATIDNALERWFTEKYRKENQTTMDLIRKWVLANKKDVYPKVYQVLVDGVDELIGERLPIKCPTLVLTGDEDYGNSPEMSIKISKQIKGSIVEILPGLRHMALIEDADTVNKILVDFLINCRK